MKIALVHDWLVSQRGGENVLEAIAELFPQADLFTLVHVPGSVSKKIEYRVGQKNENEVTDFNKRKITTSFLQKIPKIEKIYRHMLPLMPFAIEALDLSSYDLILSSSHCVAKGVKKRKDAIHISYVHAPMRYVWDRFDDYFGKQSNYSFMVRLAAKILRPFLQNWDKKSALGVDYFIANSKFIASKIKEYYNRDAKVVYPFCDTESFKKERKLKNFYLIVSALVPYKRVDLAILACNELKKFLTIVGDGPELKNLKKIAGPTIQFLPPLKKEEIAKLYSECKALLFPGIEDFGIVPCEAMCAGAPVIAYAKGGALETVTDETGVFFYEQKVSAMAQAIMQFEKIQSSYIPFDEKKIRERGQFFSKEKFQKEYLSFLFEKVPNLKNFLI
jgi:glycosyltransferase involved in cell wall biosynthesis